MATAREIMNPQAHTVRHDQSVGDAARMMRDLGVGALPVQDADDNVIGIVTDRDIVVGCCADGQDPGSVQVGTLAQGIVSTVEADEDVDRIVDLMGEQQVKRMPVMENGSLVGMISESDLARNVSEDKVHHFVQMVYGRD